MADPQRRNKKDLPNLALLGTGGQGNVYSTTLPLQNPPCKLVYKEYRQDIASNLDESILLSMIDYIKTIPQRDALRIISICSWPLCLVEHGSAGRTAGFLMPKAPSKFAGLQIRTVKGVTSTISEIQHLLNNEDELRKRYSLSLTEGLKYNLLSKVASALSTLHQRQILVGDLSPKNLLFSLNPSCEVYFLDADAMRFQGRSALPQVETPGWSIAEAYPSETLATTSSDIYKLGLLALRLLLGSQNASQHQSLPTSIPRPVRSLIQESLCQMSHNRPSLKEWMDVLQPLSTDVAAQPKTSNHAQIPRSIPLAPVPLSPPSKPITSSAAPRPGLTTGFWAKNKLLVWVSLVVGWFVVPAVIDFSTHATRQLRENRPRSTLEWALARETSGINAAGDLWCEGWIKKDGGITRCFEFMVEYPGGRRVYLRKPQGLPHVFIEPIGKMKSGQRSDPFGYPLIHHRARYGQILRMEDGTPILNLPRNTKAYAWAFDEVSNNWGYLRVYPPAIKTSVSSRN